MLPFAQFTSYGLEILWARAPEGALRQVKISPRLDIQKSLQSENVVDAVLPP